MNTRPKFELVSKMIKKAFAKLTPDRKAHAALGSRMALQDEGIPSYA
jgi:hypothetical protein